MQDSITILNIDALLNMRLTIPDYQRPYKWTIKNISDLLDDISKAIDDKNRLKDENFKYRIGTIILNQVGDEYNIVDGQQRSLSLAMIKMCLQPEMECPLINCTFSNKETQQNLHNNYAFIKNWFHFKSDEVKNNFIQAFSDLLQVVVIKVEVLAEAFQLFDSQNTRGKALDPHDLLKAYHLRAMRDNPYEMRHVVRDWEAVDTEAIKNLFSIYLFPILKWSNKEKCPPFTSKNIDAFKGISEESQYTYAKRAKKAMPYFQLTEAFIEGEDFFFMVEHYLELESDILMEIESHFKELYEIINKKYYSSGFNYARNLFYCALLCYYDKFHNFDEQAVKKLFTWAFMLRVDMQNLGMDSINKYAVGETGDGYSNPNTPIFSIIAKARHHNEIANIPLNVKRSTGMPTDNKWNDLYHFLLKLNGLEK